MATVTVYFLNTAATTPNWFGKVQDGGSAPAGALSPFGWTVGKVALTTPYWRGYLGATARSSAALATSYIDTAVRPAQGTGAGATTAGDSFRSDNPLSGTFAAGNWNFTFGMRTGAATTVGRVRLNVWASANADGTGTVRKLNSSTLVGSTVTMSLTTTTYNSTVTWAAPQIVLANEYLFTQIEWQETTVGTSNSCTAQFYAASFVTTNYVYNYLFYPVNDETLPPVLDEADLGQKHIIGTSAPTIAGPPEFEAPDLTAATPQDDVGSPPAFAVNVPTIGASTLGQAHKFTATSVAVQPPVYGAATVVLPAIPLVASDLVGIPASFGTPAMLPVVLLAPSNLATAPPVEAAAALGQKHGLGATAFALSSPPALATATLTQRQVLTAISAAAGLPTIGAPLFVQPHTFVAGLAISPPTIGAATLGVAGVMAAVPPTVPPPILGSAVLAQKHALAATQLTTSVLGFLAADLGQKYAFATPNLATSALAIGGSGLGQKHALTAAPLAPVPVLGVAVLGQAGTMAALPVAAGIPVLGAPTFGQKHLAVAQSLAMSVPALGVPALGKVLTATALAVGGPVVSSPTVTKPLTAALLTTPAPALGTPACALRVFALAPTNIAIGPPSLPALTIGQSGVMAALPVAAGAPVLGAPVLGQRHALVPSGVTVGPAVLAAAALGGKAALGAGSLAVAAPVYAHPGLEQVHRLAPIGHIAVPSLGVGNLGQAGVMACLPLWVQAPTLPVLALQQTSRLVATNLVAGAPTLSEPGVVRNIRLPRPWSTFAGRFQTLPATLGQVHQLNALAASAGRPVGLLAILVPPPLQFPAPVWLSGQPPVLGLPVLALLRYHLKVVEITGTPLPLAPLSGARGPATVTANAQRASYLTGTRNGTATIIGRRMRN